MHSHALNLTLLDVFVAAAVDNNPDVLLYKERIEAARGRWPAWGQRNDQSRGMVGVEKGFSLKSESRSMAANSRFTCRLYFLSLFEDAKRGSADGIGLGDSCLRSQRHSCCMSCSHRSLLVGTSFVVITVFSQGPGPSAS